MEHDLRGVALLALLVLPFAGLQLAFQINLRALLQILLGDLGQALVEDHDAMPLRALAPLARRLVAPAVAGGDPQIDDGPAILGVADFRIGSEIADENDFVDRSGHISTSPQLCGTYALAGTLAPGRPWHPGGIQMTPVLSTGQDPSQLCTCFVLPRLP
ncbi:hypothetical protein AUC69_04415 [Methyloceanibacter superfactus]|uniref:Uncharacterized protein n=1 Tax=Methyloceanibacter superfactus TaxID=1774969 RepID=A0A1E3VIU9_9HYPH|nr:hypothetical protein AUC69_04415 [Methyloceanibacter superfactus]